MKRERKSRVQRERRERRNLQRRRAYKWLLQQRLEEALGFTEHHLDNLERWRPVPQTLPQTLPLRLSFRFADVALAGVFALLLLTLMIARVPFAIILLITVVAFLAVTYPNLPRVLSHQRSIRIGHRIETIEGMLTKSAANMDGIPAGPLDHFQITIGDVVFDVPQNVHAAFEDGVPYRVYFMTGNHAVVAAEVLLPDE